MTASPPASSSCFRVLASVSTIVLLADSVYTLRVPIVNSASKTSNAVRMLVDGELGDAEMCLVLL